MEITEPLRYTAFSFDPAGGNPAGVVLDAAGLDDAAQLRIAAELGYSETAFLSAPPEGLSGAPGRRFRVRYFSPLAEVPFCGHATVAAAVAVAERRGPGELVFATNAGTVPVEATHSSDAADGGALVATLTSVPTWDTPPELADVTEALAALGWSAAELDPMIEPRIAYAGARHLVLAAGSRARLAGLDYDFDRLKNLMARLELTTTALVWRASTAEYHVRNAFPVGGVPEDPATGAAAAAFGGYLRRQGLAAADTRLTLRQGDDMGRPSLLRVGFTEGDDRVRVSGHAVRLNG